MKCPENVENVKCGNWAKLYQKPTAVLRIPLRSVYYTANAMECETSRRVNFKFRLFFEHVASEKDALWGIISATVDKKCPNRWFYRRTSTEKWRKSKIQENRETLWEIEKDCFKYLAHWHVIFISASWAIGHSVRDAISTIWKPHRLSEKWNDKCIQTKSRAIKEITEHESQ